MGHIERIAMENAARTGFPGLPWKLCPLWPIPSQLPVPNWKIFAGVGSENMIKMLKDKKLIAEVGRKESPGRPVMYGTTREFLKKFRMGSIADLPRLDDVDEEKFAGNSS